MKPSDDIICQNEIKYCQYADDIHLHNFALVNKWLLGYKTNKQMAFDLNNRKTKWLWVLEAEHLLCLVLNEVTLFWQN